MSRRFPRVPMRSGDAVAFLLCRECEIAESILHSAAILERSLCLAQTLPASLLGLADALLE